MPPWGLSIIARKRVAAIWFASFAFIASAMFFLHSPFVMRAVVSYVLIPSISAGAAGFILGGPILGPTTEWKDSLLRSIGVIGGAYLIFTPFFAGGLILLERGWSARQIGGLIAMTLTLGVLMVGRMLLLVGILAGLTLHKLGHPEFS